MVLAVFRLEIRYWRGPSIVIGSIWRDVAAMALAGDAHANLL
jgi:hypothetical protein